MTNGVSNGHVTDDLMWPKRCSRQHGRNPSDCMASCHISHSTVITLGFFIFVQYFVKIRQPLTSYGRKRCFPLWRQNAILNVLMCAYCSMIKTF